MNFIAPEKNNLFIDKKNRIWDKTKVFVENAKKAVKDTLNKASRWIKKAAWIGAMAWGTLWSPTFVATVPAWVEAVSTITPLTSTALNTITLWTAVSLLTACGGEDWPDSPIETKDTTPPTISVSQSSVDITWWKQVRISWNQLYIWDILVASRTDNQTKNCKVLISFNWKTITSWTTISEKWTLTIKVSDDAWNIKSTDIQLNIWSQEAPISWIENLRNLSLKVDQEVNLLEWITLWNGASLVKVQIEQNWQTSDIADPQHYSPEYPWNCSIILTVKSKEWNTTEYKVDNLNIKALEYQSPEIKNLQPKEILPITWNINIWDKKAYEHIEHTRIAEGTLMRDMMRKYWAWKYSPEQYQQLMLRLNTWAIWEIPLWFNNFELIGEKNNSETEHWHNTRDILNSIIKHANFKVLPDRLNSLEELYQTQPKNAINIFADSESRELLSKEDYNTYNNEYMNLRKYLTKDNFIRFLSWSNLITTSNNLKNKIYQENFNLTDNHSVYSIPQSNANSKNDTNIDKHIFITIWTNKSWNTNISNSTNGSKFPIWFHPDILFSWRSFPYNTIEWNVYAEDWNYATSFTNYTNLASTDLCFQLKADVPTGPELMDMIRNTSLTDQIHLDGQTQNLHLINPAWFIKEYLMPTTPSNINEWSTISLEKWFYKWVIFEIPWAEVNINWEWIPYNKENQSLIKNQNPFNLEWRLNWKLAKKMWYNQANSIKWKIIISDDKFNWLNITKDVSININ